MARLSGLWKGALWIKSSILVGIMGAMLAYEHHDQVKEVEYNVFDKKQPIAEHYFQDPPGLKVAWKPNSEGAIESILQYKSGGMVHKEVGIMRDMLPSNETLVKGVQKRLNLDGVLLGIKDSSLYMTFSDSAGTYTKRVDRSLFQEQNNQKETSQIPFDSIYNNILKFLGGQDVK